MAVTNLLGPSMRQKDATKGIIDWSIVTVGSGLKFEHKRGMPGTTSEADAQNIPWGDTLEDVVVLSIDPTSLLGLADAGIDAAIAAALADYSTTIQMNTAISTAVSGYTGTIVVSGSVTLTVSHGLITSYA